jgi:hypothetical protein
MRYFLAIMALFGFVFAACKHNTEVVCDAPQVVAQSGDTYSSIAAGHCTNPQEAVFRLMEVNTYPAGSIPVGAIILLP